MAKKKKIKKPPGPPGPGPDPETEESPNVTAKQRSTIGTVPKRYVAAARSSNSIVGRRKKNVT